MRKRKSDVREIDRKKARWGRIEELVRAILESLINLCLRVLNPNWMTFAKISSEIEGLGEKV